MSELLNEFFSSVFTREDRRNIPQLVLMDGDNQPKISDSTYSDIEITEDGVLKIIKGLKANKTGGVDDLNSSFLKGIAEAIMMPLTEIYKKSLEEVKISKDWKKQMLHQFSRKGLKRIKKTTDQSV